ncbi:SDR family NAD(P)-dependent oxidoreductase [Actinoplanes sp. RD1]|uniref:SDR family NAD(P)-dependent oxidoreductase n=1 Tax=Actinoplanes sp. RD1 TaxID=3064538 RepID=UPI00274289FE|nr:SDR family NAD(P)-dependent oxidoreductase [Actinoplanes sp. RD1]
MRLHGATALITGAGSGLGRELAEDLLRRGANVYATARRPELITLDGVRTLELDITDPASVAAAAAVAADVDLVVNNAGVSFGAPLAYGDLDQIRRTFDTHLWGTLTVIRAFAPILAAHGGGGILNLLSAVGWAPFAGNLAYSAAKAAQWGLTNAVRLELAGQGTQVSGVVLGPTATEAMTSFAARMDGGDALLSLMSAPADIARIALDGFEAGKTEIIADPASAATKATLTGEPQSFGMEMLTAR